MEGSGERDKNNNRNWLLRSINTSLVVVCVILLNELLSIKHLLYVGRVGPEFS